MQHEVLDDEPDNLVLRALRRLDEKMDRLIDDKRKIKTRLGFPEQQYGSLSSRLDRIGLWIDRIEKRLDLVEV